MKGQMIFEFIIAAVLFFAIVFYIINVLGVNVSSFSSSSQLDVFQSKALQISEMLVSSKGVWNGVEPAVVGLVKDAPVLDSEKIQNFNITCRMNYAGLKEKLGLKEYLYEDVEKEYNAKIRIYKNQTEIVDCGPYEPPKERGGVKRFALSDDGEIITVRVEVW
jgi:hypothetical protein